MPKRPLLTAVFLLAALVLALPAPAGAKGRFGPGDLRLCNDRTCLSINDRKMLDGLMRFSWMAPAPAVVQAPRIGAPYFQITNRDGNLVGIAATVRLDRFRSHWGTPQFGPDHWYRVPAGVARGLRALASDLLVPLRVTASTVGRTRYG